MKHILAMVFLLFAHVALAQEEVEMADTMRSNGKIYVVVGIVVIILVGMVTYLFLIDRKISRLEKERKEKPIEGI